MERSPIVLYGKRENCITHGICILHIWFIKQKKKLLWAKRSELAVESFLLRSLCMGLRGLTTTAYRADLARHRPTRPWYSSPPCVSKCIEDKIFKSSRMFVWCLELLYKIVYASSDLTDNGSYRSEHLHSVIFDIYFLITRKLLRFSNFLDLIWKIVGRRSRIDKGKREI